MRTQKNVVDYFPHDATASDGDTLTILEGLFGNDGYAFWFKLLEKLALSENHYIDINKDSKWQLFCSKVHITPEEARKILEKLVELDAIDTELWESGIIWSKNLVNNIAPVYKNRRRELPSKPVTTSKNPSFTGSKAITTGSKAITTPQSRVEYSRVEYSRVYKEKKSLSNQLPDWLNKDTWDAFLEMRLKKKATPTEKARELLINELDKLRLAGDDPSDVLNQSIMNGWKGVFPLNKKQGGQNGTNKTGYRHGIPGQRPAGAFDDLEDRDPDLPLR